MNCVDVSTQFAPPSVVFFTDPMCAPAELSLNA